MSIGCRSRLPNDDGNPWHTWQQQINLNETQTVRLIALRSVEFTREQTMPMIRSAGTTNGGIAMIATIALWWPSAQAEDQPNVVFILADDLGWMDLSISGSEFYETPHIDRIGSSGIQFTQGYATCQVCSPSRASIMTGRHPARLHITDWIGAKSGYQWEHNGRILPAEYEHELPADDMTIAEAFRDARYSTFFAGKWHLGGKGSWPEDHGFEVNRGGHERGSPPGGYFAPYRNPTLEDGPDGESLPLRLGQETADFIRSSKDGPFFAFLAFYSVHSPIQTTRPRWQRYQKKAEELEPPSERFLIDRTLPVRQVQDCPVYAGMIEAMDEAVGRVLTMLDELKLTGNTYIVFTSDNGGVSSGDAFATSNLPLRGGKGRQWEGGIREPYFISGPGINPGTCQVPVTGTDFYPTLLDLCGLTPQPEQHVDGLSLVPLIKTGLLSTRDLFWHYPHYGNQGGEPSSIIRRGPWKLIHYWEDGRQELYNIQDDLGEISDVAAQHPQLAKTLNEALTVWLKDVGAAIPQPDPRFDQARYAAREQQIRLQLKPRLEKQHARMLRPDFRPDPSWWGSFTTVD